MKIGILASTNGTILPAIWEYLKDDPSVEFVVLVSNREQCGARKKAEEKGIPSIFVGAKGKTREEWDAEVLSIFRKYDVELVILVGFMRILSPVFVRAFPQKILNVHPSLLPKFAGGMDGDVHSAVLQSGETESGATIHLVDEGVDTGKIILQKSVAISSDETPESLKAKVQDIEGLIFAESIRKFSFPQDSKD